MREYLTALEHRHTGRGRRRTPASVALRLKVVESKLDAADPLARLQLLQEREDLRIELANTAPPIDLAAAEERFVEVAAAYARRKGIGYNAWRAAGVSPPVLRRAGIQQRLQTMIYAGMRWYSAAGIDESRRFQVGAESVVPTP